MRADRGVLSILWCVRRIHLHADSHLFEILSFSLAFTGFWIYIGLLGIPPDAGGEMLTAAQTLARTGYFSDPFHGGPTGPTAHIPPLYPGLLAILIHVCGEPAWQRVLIFLTGIVVAVQAGLLPALSRKLFGAPYAGAIGAALGVLLPVFTLGYRTWDAVVTGTALAGYCLFCLSHGNGRFGRFWMQGCFAGCLLLTNPAVLMAIIPIVLASGPWRFKRIAIIGTGAFLVCLPWMTRNYYVLGTFAIRDNLGLELYVSHHPRAHSSLRVNIAAGLTVTEHPDGSSRIASDMRTMGEVRYNAKRRREAFANIRSEPIRSLNSPQPGSGTSGSPIRSSSAVTRTRYT